jgi:hypothetical protein
MKKQNKVNMKLNFFPKSGFLKLKIVNIDEHFRFKPWPFINPFNLTNTHLSTEPSPLERYLNLTVSGDGRHGDARDESDKVAEGHAQQPLHCTRMVASIKKAASKKKLPQRTGEFR